MQQEDADPLETREWIDALESVRRTGGTQRVSFLLQRLLNYAETKRVALPPLITTPYRNTIPPAAEKPQPGDVFMERKIRCLVRWNALAMVMRANNQDSSLGGHISSFSSSATLYEMGFNHFFRASRNGQPGDLVYYQGHCSPGIYARSYLEGRLSEQQLDNFRREVGGAGLSSYPHPWLMPDYWQFPTVSMGLGPIQAIYQAHMMKYQASRELVEHGERKVWAFLGDGECDEPESLGAISLAGRERLDNLIFVVNCNLQRLDGPVRGNGKIIQELEGQFRGAGWNVIKVIWGGKWDRLLERDQSGLLQKRMDEVVDGELQNYKFKGGAYTRKNFFGHYPQLLQLVRDLSDTDIMYLNRGGHDTQKVYAAYHAAFHHQGTPTVILAQTVKGYGTGDAGEAHNEAHSLKKLDLQSLRRFRDRFAIPISDQDLPSAPYYRPAKDSPEMAYMRKCRERLGGAIPARRTECKTLKAPSLDIFRTQLKDSGERRFSTTMAFVRMLSSLVRDKNIGPRVVPIVPDEARTFGMEGMFRQLGIYSSQGQLYEPHDADQILYYKEDKKGQILEEGINEAGAFCAWLAAACSYSSHDYPMVPFYIFYSMFGFQRVGDLSWLAGDAQARGFLIGATAGRTTLNGEGLQHQDGQSHVMADFIPNCVAYDPCYAYEMAVIIQDGLRRMYQEKENRFYYITAMNENYSHPALPDGAQEGIIRGMYLLEERAKKSSNAVQLAGCGAILGEVRAAAVLLREEYGVDADVWSLTSIQQLRREALAVQRWNLLHPDSKPRLPYVTQQLARRGGPLIAATDYVKTYADLLRPFVPHRYHVLGTDGFGRSDTRERLRHFFEVSRHFIVVAALYALLEEGRMDKKTVSQALKKYGIDAAKPDPLLS